MKVFVYGTLKKGFHNHRCLEGATFVKEAVLNFPVRMYDTGGFPIILPASENKPGYFPTGEVYELPEGRDGELVLARLDRLESEGVMYHRRVHPTIDGEDVYVYVADQQMFRHYEKRPLGKCVKLDDKMETVTYTRAA
jgi:gamma-glutamylcyclotransferase (GGCT)/AIG2-like uncharacterized protein YtfP